MNEQAALFNADDIDDSALLFGDEIRKRYTAQQVHGLECKRNAILMLVASDWPVETIARQLHVNLRTVTALAKRSGEEVAGFKKEFASMLMRTGGRWLGLARTKEDSASFKDLTIGAGIVMQHARELHMMGESGEEKVVKEEQDHAQAAAALRAMMGGERSEPGKLQPGEAGPDFESGVKACSDNGLQSDGAGDGAGPTRTGQDETEGKEGVGGPGGGQVGPTDGSEPIHFREGGTLPNGSNE